MVRRNASDASHGPLLGDGRTLLGAGGLPARTAPDAGRPGFGSAAFRWIPYWPLCIWALLVAGALLARPPMGDMELPGLSIAWEMWLEGSLLPRLNGQLLAEQPPLLFWLIGLAWRAFGLSEDVARLVAPLFALGSMLLIGPVARVLWPDRRMAAPVAAILLAGTGAFAALCASSLPVLLLLFFACLALLGLALAWRQRPVAGWSLFGLGLGLGFLASGIPAIISLLPVALAAPLWQRRPSWGWGAWFAGLAGALVAAGAIGLPWLWPAAATHGWGAIGRLAAGPTYSASFAAPWYWPAIALPALLYPWILWRTLWRALRRQRRRFHDPALRLCLAAATAALASAWLCAEGEVSAFLPAIPPLVLIATRLVAAHGGKPRDFHAVIPGLLALLAGGVVSLLNIIPVAHLDAVWRELVSENSLPIWFGGSSLLPGLLLLGGGFVLAQMTPRELISRVVQLALLPLLFVTAANIEFRVSLRQFFDLAPVASKLQELQAEGRQIGFRGHYRGELNFPGRLLQPVVVLGDAQTAVSWAAGHPDAVIVSYFEGSLLRLPEQPSHLGPAGNRWAALWPAETVVATGGAVLSPRF